MLYTLYYQERYGDTVAIAKSKSLLKLLKIKFVTCGFDTRAFIANDNEKEEFNKFDLSADERALYSAFEVKVQGGRYFPTYDYRQRAREHYLVTL